MNHIFRKQFGYIFKPIVEIEREIDDIIKSYFMNIYKKLKDLHESYFSEAVWLYFIF